MTHRLHLAPSNSAAGATKMALPDQEIAAFPDSLTDGPVTPIGDTTGVRQWLIDRWRASGEGAVDRLEGAIPRPQGRAAEVDGSRAQGDLADGG